MIYLISSFTNMQKSNKLAVILRWVARLSGTAIILFVLYFLFMHFFASEGSENNPLISSEDIFAFVCFPLSTIIGLAIAYKWEGVGGLISTLGFIILFVIRPDLSSSPIMTALALPGLLYLIYWILAKKKQKPIIQN